MGSGPSREVIRPEQCRNDAYFEVDNRPHIREIWA